MFSFRRLQRNLQLCKNLLRFLLISLKAATFCIAAWSPVESERSAASKLLVGQRRPMAFA
jgi:hypothetical protein